MAIYDGIAEQYKRRVVLPIHKHVRQYTLFKLIGDFTGKSVLDLACGDGFYTRMFKPAAKSVVGVDISARVIEFARAEEARDPRGIEYIVADVLELEEIGSFDLVVAVQLLHYAQTKEMLLRMCQRIHANLKAGGRFLTVNANFDRSHEEYMRGQQYGLPQTAVAGTRHEGMPITVTFVDADGRKSDFTIYYFNKDTYRWAFEAAGFKEVRWHQPLVSPEGVAEFGQEFWQDALECPRDWHIECVK